MPRRPQETEIQIEDQTYKIKKFTPDKACKWAFRLLGNMDLAGASNDLSDEEAAKEMNKKIQSFTAMPEKEFKEFQKDCLASVWAVHPAQTIPVLNSDGSFAIVDIEATTIFELTLHSFMFSIMDFLDQSFLGRMMKGLTSMAVSPPSNREAVSTPPTA